MSNLELDEDVLDGDNVTMLFLLGLLQVLLFTTPTTTLSSTFAIDFLHLLDMDTRLSDFTLDIRLASRRQK
jgi:hypothetical protein